jgi:deoxyribose-phosphate aldolase
VRLKVILETGELGDAATIRAAADLALAAGADFVKTSTGKVKINATPEAAAELLAAIRACGRPAGFKAAGGIRTIADAAAYLALADAIMGPAWAAPATFRFGASGLLDALHGVLDGAAVSSAADY